MSGVSITFDAGFINSLAAELSEALLRGAPGNSFVLQPSVADAPTDHPLIGIDFQDRYLMPMPEFLERSGLPRSRAYSLLKDNRLASVLVGTRRYIIIPSFLGYLRAQQQAPTPPPLPQLKNQRAPANNGARGSPRQKAKRTARSPPE